MEVSHVKCVKIDESTLNAIKFARKLIEYTINSNPPIRSEMNSELMGHMSKHMQRLTELIATVEEVDET